MKPAGMTKRCAALGFGLLVMAFAATGCPGVWQDNTTIPANYSDSTYAWTSCIIRNKSGDFANLETVTYNATDWNNSTWIGFVRARGAFQSKVTGQWMPVGDAQIKQTVYNGSGGWMRVMTDVYQNEAVRVSLAKGAPSGFAVNVSQGLRFVKNGAVDADPASGPDDTSPSGGCTSTGP